MLCCHYESRGKLDAKLNLSRCSLTRWIQLMFESRSAKLLAVNICAVFLSEFLLRVVGVNNNKSIARFQHGRGG